MMANRRWILGLAGGAVLAAVVLKHMAGRESEPAFIDPANQARVMQRQGRLCQPVRRLPRRSDARSAELARARLPNGRLPAPPHDQTGHTWHHPDAVLVDIVKNGLVPGKTAPPGYESDMPAYRSMLTDEEIVDVIAYIKSSWPPKVLEAQKEVTLQQRD